MSLLGGVCNVHKIIAKRVEFLTVPAERALRVENVFTPLRRSFVWLCSGVAVCVGWVTLLHSPEASVYPVIEDKRHQPSSSSNIQSVGMGKKPKLTSLTCRHRCLIRTHIVTTQPQAAVATTRYWLLVVVVWLDWVGKCNVYVFWGIVNL